MNNLVFNVYVNATSPSPASTSQLSRAPSPSPTTGTLSATPPLHPPMAAAAAS
ncbi:unnamed protein product [Spirodela intermedia]|uniref:Uncharacterized protein n=1 Tax=Spirodela intermedia TaxID=51605 RepID=A0ABN7EAK6_SPIIN|nr:unnamed protein product [Spirodela intermedia]